MKEFKVGQKVWRNAAVNGYAMIEVGIITWKKAEYIDKLENGKVVGALPTFYHKVSVDGVERDKCINVHEWFESKEELINDMFRGKD